VSLTLTIVGSAPAWATRPGLPSSCYLVELGDVAIALDLGQGSLGALHAHREPSTLRAVVISHLHADHHVDLVPLRHLLRYGFPAPRHVELHAPKELRARYDAFLGEDGFLDGLPGPDLVPGVRPIGPMLLEIVPVTHALNSHAFRVSAADGNGSPGVVYSGDCGRAADLLPLIRPGDSLLCEAFWGASEVLSPEAEHLTAIEAARTARAASAGRLMLTHVAEWYDPERAVAQAREIFAGPVSLAEPGMRIAVT
jgi:ribonuclease BN (tRNA processing enzyme)